MPTETTQTSQQQADAGAGQQTTQAAGTTAAGKTGTTGSETQGTQQSGKGAEATTTAQTAELTFKFPEGVQENQKYTAGLKKILSDSKLSPQERAQGLIDHHFAMVKESQDAEAKAIQAHKTATIERRKQEWGAQYDANMDAINKAALKYGGQDFVKWIQEHGLDYSDPFAKFVLAVGKGTADDKIDTGKPGSGQDNSRAGELKAMFPNSPEMFQGKRP